MATIPESHGEAQILSIRVYWCSIEVLVDGEVIYSYEDEQNRKGTCQQWIELPKGSEGKRISLRTSDLEGYLSPTISKECYIGERSAVFYRFLLDNLQALLLGGITLVLGIIMMICSIAIKKKPVFENISGTKYLALFMISSGAWILTDSRILQLFTGKTGAIAIISFIVFMLMPFFMLHFLEEMMMEKKKGIEIMCAVLLLNIIVSLGLYLLHIVRIFQIIVIHHVLIVITLVMMLKFGHDEIVRYKNEEMRQIQKGLIIMTALCGLSMLVFYINPAFPYAILYGGGIVIFEVCLAMAAIKKLYYHLERSASTAAYHELAYQDVMTGMSNRTAFVEEQEKHRNSENLAYIMLDLNDLKKVNDYFGHREGDALIIQAAECIREAFENEGKCFRLGGDEFLVMMEETSEKNILNALERLQKKVDDVNQSRSIGIFLAYGYALRDNEDEPVEHLFSMADEAMYRRKSEMKKEKYTDS